MTYAEKLRDPRWQKKRLRVMERHQFMCMDCGSETKPLAVHHTFYAKGMPWETEEKFLLTLCDDCHAIRQPIENEIRRSIGAILAGIGPLDEHNIHAPLKAFADSCRELAAKRTPLAPIILDMNDDA